MNHEWFNQKLPKIQKPVISQHLDEIVPAWFANYLIEVERLEDIYELLACANFLEVKNLIELCCAYIGC